MAKLGEGDARWIVTERADGTNVHGWHWAEKDVSDWAKQRLNQLLGDKRLVDSDSLQASTSDEVLVTGEAVVNNRKNKLIPAYELEITGAWAGTAKDESGAEVTISGNWTIPYLAEENADEDPELRLSTSSEGPAQRRAKEAALAQGKKVILDAVRQFVREISAGGPAAKEGVITNDTSQKAQPVKAVPTAAERICAKPAQTNGQKKQAAKPGSRQSLDLIEKFYARARDIYECFTDANRIQAYTRSPAKAVPQVGGAFEIFGGSVIGKFTELEQDRRIALDWHFRNWEEGVVSKVVISLEEPQEGTTILKLLHSDIPLADRFDNEDVLDTTTNGWKQQIFHKIRAVFGYGLGL